VFTESGTTARQIARHRHVQPIIALTPHVATLRHLNFNWGVQAMLISQPKDFLNALPKARVAALKNPIRRLKKGDKVVISAGLHGFGTSGSTNLILVEEI